MAAVPPGMTAGNEIIHGLVDRIMQLVSVRPSAEYSPDGAEAAALRDNTEPRGEYLIKPSMKMVCTFRVAVQMLYSDWKLRR